MRDVQPGAWNALQQTETFLHQEISLSPVNIHQDVTATFDEQQSLAGRTVAAPLDDVEGPGDVPGQHPALPSGGLVQQREQSLQLSLRLGVFSQDCSLEGKLH